MPFWHQKNELCYNSRYSDQIFISIVIDYCKGIPASQSSAEFQEQIGSNISRQTISSYFERISKCVIEDRVTYPWWSLDWDDFEDKHFNLIRDVVYNKNSITKSLRNKFRDLTGSDRSVDSYFYIELLRKMSKELNGLPKNKFWSHLIRACEISLPYQMLFDETGKRIEFGHPKLLGLASDHVIHLFQHEGYSIFRRKESKALRIQRQELIRSKRERRDRNPFCDDHHYGPSLTRKIDNSSESQDKRLLAPLDGNLETDFGNWTSEEDS